MVESPTTTSPTTPPTMSAEVVRERLDMPLREAMETQRAVRRLLPDPVDDAIVLRCIELALRAPTGSNGQNWEFVVVKDQAIKEQLGARYREAWALYGGVGGWLAANLDDGGVVERIARAAGTGSGGGGSTRRILRAVQWQVDHFAELPVLVVACLRGARVPFVPAPPVQASSFYGSIYPSVQNLLLAARAVGLGASLITLPLWSTTRARRILGLPLSVLPCCIVPLGWPRGRYGPTTRRPVGEVVHLDRYGNQPWRDAGTEPAPHEPVEEGT